MGEYLPTVDVGSNILVAQMAGGGQHFGILSEKGKVKLWGLNLSGQVLNSQNFFNSNFL